MACKEPTRRCHFAATQRSPQMSTHSPACRADSTIQVLFVLMHWKKGTLVLVCEGEERVARYDTLAKTHTRHELTLIEADASVNRTLAFQRNVDHVETLTMWSHPSASIRPKVGAQCVHLHMGVSAARLICFGCLGERIGGAFVHWRRTEAEKTSHLSGSHGR